MLCVGFFSFEDGTSPDRTFFIILWRPSNEEFLLKTNYALLGIDLLTSAFDVVILVYNKRQLRRKYLVISAVR